METTTFITDKEGKKISAILPIKKYRQLLEDLEELADIRMYDAVKASKEKSIPFDEFVKTHKAKRKAHA